MSLVYALGALQIIAEPTLQERADFTQCIDTQDEESCFDLIVNSCVPTLDTETHEGVLACAQRELTLWEELVEARYEALLEVVEGAEEAQSDEDGGDPRDELRASQSFWESLRDSDCAHMASAYRVETLSRLTALECFRLQSAERAIWLGTQLTKG